MATTLIVFSTILAVSVVAHVLLWRASKKQYDACLKQAQALNEQLRKLEANGAKIDGMLDEVDAEVQKMVDEIDTMRSALFVNRKRTTNEKEPNEDNKYKYLS